MKQPIRSGVAIDDIYVKFRCMNCKKEFCKSAEYLHSKRGGFGEGRMIVQCPHCEQERLTTIDEIAEKAGKVVSWMTR